MNQKTLTTRQPLGATFRQDGSEEENRPQFALATEIDRAIDLSCRACGAMAMGAGLGFPVGDSAALRFHPQPPIGMLCLTYYGRGVKRSDAEALTGNPSPAPTHPHRTHGTTDQWRDRRWWPG